MTAFTSTFALQSILRSKPAERKTQQKSACIAPGEKKSSNPAALRKQTRRVAIFYGRGRETDNFRRKQYRIVYQERPFGFKLSETRTKTNGPSLDHLAPAGHPDADSRQSACYFRTKASRFSYYQAHPRSSMPWGEYKDMEGNTFKHFCGFHVFQFTKKLHSQARKD